MKTKIFLILAFLITALNANQNPFILTHDGLIDQRVQDKLLQIGSEVKSKLNVNLYVDIRENNGIREDLPFKERQTQMRKFEQYLVKDLKGSYALLVIVLDQKHVTVLMSDDLKNIIDKEDIRSGYVVPLLASKDKNSLFTKTSAAVLNGFAQMGDSIAKTKNIKLDSSIGSEGKTASTIWRMFMYTLVFGGILLYALIILKEKKYKKKMQQEQEGK